MTDIWQGYFYTDSPDDNSISVTVEHGVYHGTGADINAEIKLSEQMVSDFINLKPDGQTVH